MEATAVAILAGILGGLGYLVRRLIERSGETERLQRRALVLDMERNWCELQREQRTVHVVVMVLPRE